MPITLGSLDVTIVLGGLVALFGLFVSVQIGWLFGGERLVRATTGLGYAQYARHGFFELVWVSLLVLPVLLGSRSALRDDDGTAVRRHRLSPFQSSLSSAASWHRRSAEWACTFITMG